jgi:hypothetical protein
MALSPERKTMTNQLVSYFYLITLEHKPVYVGYTNRPIKQRIAELRLAGK